MRIKEFMKFLLDFNLSEYLPVNNLWPGIVEDIGLDKARNATRQAFDIQRMNGTSHTIPVIFAETCGLALVDTNALRTQTGFSFSGENYILILSKRTKTLQLICQA